MKKGLQALSVVIALVLMAQVSMACSASLMMDSFNDQTHQTYHDDIWTHIQTVGDPGTVDTGTATVVEVSRMVTVPSSGDVTVVSTGSFGWAPSAPPPPSICAGSVVAETGPGSAVASTYSSRRQNPSQPSSGTTLPSSHSSAAWFSYPSPQKGHLHSLGSAEGRQRPGQASSSDPSHSSPG